MLLSSAACLLSQPTGPVRCDGAVCLLMLPRSAQHIERDLVSQHPSLTLGLPTASEVPEVASLLVRSFPPPASKPAPKASVEPANPWDAFIPTTSTSPPPPATPVETWGKGAESVPLELRDAGAAVLDRWQVVCKGLCWRLGSRLEQSEGDVSASLQTSLMLTLLETDVEAGTGTLVACAELSMRPLDGRLVEEFAIPASFCLHTTDRIGAYLSNVAVDPSRRGRGYATALLRACEAVVLDVWQQPDLSLHCDPADSATSRLYAAYEHLHEYDSVCQTAAQKAISVEGEASTSSTPVRESEPQLAQATPAPTTYQRRRLRS
jgi:GNAT superfamily N-acetyltransferase